MVINVKSSDLEQAKSTLEDASTTAVARLRDIGLDVSATKTEYVYFNRQGLQTPRLHAP